MLTLWLLLLSPGAPGLGRKVVYVCVSSPGYAFRICEEIQLCGRPPDGANGCAYLRAERCLGEGKIPKALVPES